MANLTFQSFSSLNDPRLGKTLDKAVNPSVDLFGNPAPGTASRVDLGGGYFVLLPRRPLTDDERGALDITFEEIKRLLTPNRSEPEVDPDLTVNMHTGQPFAPDPEPPGDLDYAPPIGKPERKKNRLVP